MDNKDILKLLEIRRKLNVDHSSWRRLMITKKLIRCVDGNTLIAAMGCDQSKDEQIHSVVDAVHWHLQDKKDFKNLQIVFGRRSNPNEMEEVLNAAAIMVHNLRIPLNISIAVDFVNQDLEIKLQSNHREWIKKITDNYNDEPPPLAQMLGTLVNDESFRWYRSVTGNFWSGRLDGLQVCTVNKNGISGEHRIGRPGRQGDGQLRKEFKKIAGNNEGFFNQEKVGEIADVIKSLSISRKSGTLSESQREHLLESMVLRNAVKIISSQGQLTPVCKKYPFQFPTLWSQHGKPRFIDALMRKDNIPWAIELKEPQGSSIGQGYRHAITQAVLYREFIQRAKEFQPWFKRKDLDHKKCRSAIAFPRIDKSKRKILDQHKIVAQAFDVELIEIDDFE